MPEGVDKGRLYLPEQSGLEPLQFSSACLEDTVMEKLPSVFKSASFHSSYRKCKYH